MRLSIFWLTPAMIRCRSRYRSGPLRHAHRGRPAPGAGVVGIGWDVPGAVDALGPEVAGFRRGDAVMGLSGRPAPPLEAQAEYVVLGADAVAAVSAGTGLVAAATPPPGGLTAARARDIAAPAGVRVVAVAGADDEELVRDLGAEFFVPRTADLPAAVRPCARWRARGSRRGSVGVPELDAARGGSSLVSVLGDAPTPLRGIRVGNVWIRADGPRLAESAAAGLRPRVADGWGARSPGAGAGARR
ncbi:hypothetical protein ABT373_40445 [Streptomyces sp. NPDC000070]|uniref:hypothetical protein n=1 Tax=Streptomyces sp. NPDC000070 TaxID=3154240 RepID=UPI0033273DD6